MAEPADEPSRVVVRISVRTVVLAVVTVVVAIVAQRFLAAAHQPLSWALASAVVAVMIDPLVDVLDRRIPRLASVIVSLVVVAALTWLAIYVAFDDLSAGVDRLGESAREAAAELEERADSIGRAARDVDASRRVDLFVDALDERVTGTDDVLESTAGTAPTYFVGGILTLFLMSYGPRLASSAAGQVPDPRQRAALIDVVTNALRRARRALWMTIAEGVAVGLVVAGVAALFDIPAPAALGLVAGVMAMLPHLGLVLGTLPLVLLMLTLRSDLAALATAVAVVVAQLVDSFWLRRRVALHSVHIGLLVPWVVALVGYRAYGVGGVAYGLALAVFALAALDEIGRRRAPGRAEADRPGDAAVADLDRPSHAVQSATLTAGQDTHVSRPRSTPSR